MATTQQLFDGFLTETIINGKSFLSNAEIFNSDTIKNIPDNNPEEKWSNYIERVNKEINGNNATGVKEIILNFLYLHYLPIDDVDKESKINGFENVKKVFGLKDINIKELPAPTIGIYGTNKAILQNVIYLKGLYKTLLEEKQKNTDFDIDKIKDWIINTVIADSEKRSPLQNMLLYLCNPQKYDSTATTAFKRTILEKLWDKYIEEPKYDKKMSKIPQIDDNLLKLKEAICKKGNYKYEKNDNGIAIEKEKGEGISIFWLPEIQEKWNEKYVKPEKKSDDDNNVLEKQIIFYGAPGTGKSNTIKREVDEKGESCIRTTFHPDSDYASFVGCYKPTMEGDKIVYKFVKQAFLKAYIKAWKFYVDAKEEGETPKRQYLIIEEINRGNCAQIFGDLFQLLDRTDDRFSEYPIEADEDICKALKCIDSIDDPSFGENGLQFTSKQISFINSQYNKNGINQNVAEKLSKGEVLVLPPNLYIWATMNTSDQSLFPIDSAFKRRWEWKYVPIYDCKKDWRIEGDTNEFDWWSFLEKINTEIGDLTHSEDKKLGYFFCKADGNGIISADKFVSKVIFYLWNDVFKDLDFEGKIFKDGESGILSFNKFYYVENGKTVVNKDKVQLFLETNLELSAVAEEEDDDGNTRSSTSRNYDKFSINGNGFYAKNRLAENCVIEYIKNNPTMSADDVVKNWKELENTGSIVSHFIESEATFNARTDKGKDRSTKISCGGTFIYVAHDGYGANGKVEKLMEAVNKKNWGLTLEKHMNK